MIAWKMFVRSVGAVALLTAGALTAAQEMPFSHASRGTDPAVEVDEAPAEEEAPDVDPAAEVDDETTTEPEVEAPDTDAPEVDVTEVTEDDDPAPVVAVPKVKPAKEAPAAKAKKDCHETHPWKGDHNDDGHCDQGWHNKDADWVADRGQKAAGAPSAAAAKGDHNNDGHADNGGKAADAADRGARPETAPGQVKKAERHSEAGR
jgi:hypothetical protein